MMRIVAICLAVVLAGCGTTVEQRGATGALIGGGIGVLAGGPLGLLIGAGAGGAGGAYLLKRGVDDIAKDAAPKLRF